jgi:hypothetical protein
MDNKFQLWSPPLLDLSLDSFSNDLFQEFDKTRSTIHISGTNEEEKEQQEQTKLDEAISSSVTLLQPPNNNTSESIELDQRAINSSSVLSQLPAEEEAEAEADTKVEPEAEAEAEAEAVEEEIAEHEEQEPSSTSNLFRKSSTFLKKKLQNNRNSTVSTSPSSIITATTTTTSAEISSIVSRQYPPKPLQYSPIVEPPTDDIKALARKSNSVNGSSTRNSRDSSQLILTKTLTTTMDPPSAVYQTAVKPVTIAVAPTVIETPKVTEENKHSQTKPPTTDRSLTNAAPKRRSFFSLRFC